MRQLSKQLPILLGISLILWFSNHGLAQTYAQHGMVVSDNVLSSEVGVAILEKGGNAIDASVATAFALAVTHPEAGNIGGGGFLVFMGADSRVTTIDFREKAPIKASPDMYLDKAGEFMEGSNTEGLKSVGVPGTVAGLYLAHRKYGKLPWGQLVQPAVDLAANGFPLPWSLHTVALMIPQWGPSYDILQHYFSHPDGTIVNQGEIWKQPALANTLALIRDRGHDGFYKGEVANEIARYMAANDGLITTEDLKRYKAVEREPITGTFRDYTIYSMPPPSSGGVALIEMLNMMELADLQTIPFNSAPYVHLVAETMRRAYADRAQFLGDPDFNADMPLGRLTSKSFAKSRFDTIDRNNASQSDSTQYGLPNDGSHTTHLSIADTEGNAVSLTYTLERSYGSGLGSPKLGFIFNNEMGDFNPVPGVTTSDGQIGSAPNLIAPEKRMLSSMTPTIVSKDGKPFLIIGSPGGRTIINTVFQTVLNVLAYNMRIDRAIEAMKIHHQWLPDILLYEKDLLSPDTATILEKMGHRLQSEESLGVLMGITYDPELKVYIGAADSSSANGTAIGY